MSETKPTQFALFDPAVPEPRPVLGWFDIGALTYPTLPPADTLLEVTPEQWQAHNAKPSHWAVQDGQLIEHTQAEPPLTPAQQAALDLANFLAAGLNITSAATPALDGRYAIEPADMAEINIEAQFIVAFGTFTTGDAADLPWHKANGNSVAFPTTATFSAFAQKAGLAVAAAKRAAKAGSAMPSNSAEIA